MFADYHVHSAYSDDSEYPLEQVIRDAVAMGMDEICLTDHVDYGIKVDWDEEGEIPYYGSRPRMNVDYPRYMAQLHELQQRYGDRIRIKIGLEFGMQTHTIPRYRALFARYPLDFVILSIHQVDDQEFWTQDFQRGRTQQEYHERYYEELLAVMQEYKDYSVLGHLDSITRYDKQGVYPFGRVRPIVEQILRRAIEDGKGIEVNTSSYRYGLSDTTPSVEILKLYRELGGTILTIGSDSHAPAYLGTHITETRALLRELGFRQFCTFDRMQPVFHSL